MPLPLQTRSLLLLAVSLCAASPLCAEKLRITSIPPGATVEIDGVALGTTPFEKDYPGGYFHRTKTFLGARLEHPLTARLSLAGYATKEIALTEGPMEWISLNGRNRAQYWLLKTKSFSTQLDRIETTFNGTIDSHGAAGVASLTPQLSLEVLARLTKPAVVQLRGSQKMGSGFFVTETGVIATNAHVAREEGNLLVLLADGTQLPGSVAYIDAERDIALVKITAKNTPHLALAAADTVRQGEEVVAIGNPGGAMPFSMTRGIVSAVGKFPNAGPGTWVQTDAPINPGNSGGPLLNLRGEVIGMNTQKLVTRNVTGIGFALSAGDLLEILQRFYPVVQVRPADHAAGVQSLASNSATGSAAAVGTTRVSFPGPAGAQIYVDGSFVANAPSSLQLPAGAHTFRISAKGMAEWTQQLQLVGGSEITLQPD
ncbi:MAG TPA: trypsin-like peptidase domain-containing protein [Dongiaceae bacterium]|nr:trypsin-like peptidase domain-containing protein [Dongiaceae bacterium]